MNEKKKITQRKSGQSHLQWNGVFIGDPVPSIYSSASPWVGSQPCGAKYPGFCADSKGV